MNITKTVLNAELQLGKAAKILAARLDFLQDKVEEAEAYLENVKNAQAGLVSFLVDAENRSEGKT